MHIERGVQYITQKSMTGSEPLLQYVAANLRAARAVRGWTQQQLAERASVSRRMVVAIEAGESNVSLGTLDRLAAALGVSFGELVREPAPAGAAVLAPMLVWRGGSGESQARLLASVPAAGVVELWEWRLAAGERYAADPDRPGTRVLVHLLSGELTVEAGGLRERLAAGDTLAFPSDQPYSYRNEGSGPARFVKNVVG